MNKISLGKKDVIWSYIAQFLSMGAGVLTLPFILNRLTVAEIGLNYILVTVGSVIALVDLGFAPQFARNFTYVFSGAQELKKEGIGRTGEETNYELLGYLLKTARYIYGYLALFALILLLTVGTSYIYKATDGFSNVPNALIIWVIYSIGVLFQIFYSYYFSMLLGAGKIKEQKFALIGNKVIYIGITIGGLYVGWGLISVALAQLISPFFGRILSYRYFYTSTLKERLREFSFETKERIIDIFRTLWYNAKRTAIMSIGAYAIMRFSMFIAGLFLSLEEFASYGLMIQLMGIIGNVSCTFMQISQPKLASLRASGKRERLLQAFSLAYDIFLILFMAGSIVLIFWGSSILSLIKSNAILPNKTILILYCIVMLLEYNHSNFAGLISTDNKVPFAPASIITGIAVCIGVFCVVYFTKWGIMGLVIVQGICQAVYQNWKWPLMALNEFNISIVSLVRIGIKYIFKKVFDKS
ncbi:MAG: polysaccharide biosynthesis protein [Muribaculaceae bacterium]|nr:polysaccharide biosynthesis protein [Muribaculaceae bacterium]